MFEADGIMSKKVGKKYRDEILAPAGTRDSLEGIVNFLGRAPTEAAFLEAKGFI